MTRSSSLPVITVATWRRLGWTFLWLLLGIYYVEPVTRVLEPDLDSSIHASYAYLTAHGFQFGPQVNTTAGPYGFVMFGWDYGGNLFWTRLGLTFSCALALAALTLWFFRAARGSAWRWPWLAAMILELSVSDTLYSAAVMLGGLFVLVNYFRAERRWATVGVMVFLALLALMKGTQLAESLGVLCCVLLLALRSHAWRRAGWISGSFLLALVAWSFAAGQNPLNLPAYVNGLRHLAEGYNEAMALETPALFLGLGVALLVGLGGLLGWTAWRHRTHAAMLATCALLAGFTFVLWKHGYLRSDDHMLIFVDFASIAAFTLPALTPLFGLSAGSVAARAGRAFLVVAIAVLSVAGSQLRHPDRLTGFVRDLGSRWSANLRYLADAPRVKAGLDHDLARQRRKFALPEVQRLVGDQPIDFFGHQLGLLFLNDLNYQPAPTCCGTYVVYNQYLKERNRRHYADPRTRPAYVLLKIQSIDDRFAPLDDSLSLLALVDLYRPISFEDDALLLQAGPPAARSATPRQITTRKVRFGEDIPVPDVSPDEILLFSVSLPASLRGKTRALLYKPPLLFMDAQGEGLVHTRNQRVMAASLASPSLLNPTLEDTSDFVALLSGQARKRITSFRLHTPQPDCFRQDELVVTFFTRHRPPPLSSGNLRMVRAHAVFQEPPDSVEPEAAAINPYKGLRVQYLHAPTAITYQLKGDERAVAMVVGIDENAYLTGRTDGVDFYVELEQPNQPRQLLTHRTLNPLAVPADRGTHRLYGILPPAFAPGSKLILRTDPGPAGNAAWDWAFTTYISITHGGLRPEQFPGFVPVPTAVEGNAISRLDDGSRLVTMLNAPATVTFALNGQERELRFTGGLLAGSYLQGQTDGAAFVVDLELPGGAVQRLSTRLLQPRTVAADRGDQAISVPLPPHVPGSRLHLRTNVGPANNGAWDWVYVSALRLQ